MHLAWAHVSICYLRESKSKVHSPRSAMSKDVLPDPVGPSTRLRQPCLNVRSSSMSSVNTRLEGAKVILILSAAVQVKAACRMPITLSAGGACPKLSAATLAVSENSSSSSVWRRKLTVTYPTDRNDPYLVKELVKSISRYFSYGMI